ncbi:galanin receptor type 2-like [Lytechinus pictus]|uniref:galanin receptor type 2-like n=1 Tax=Lytechinus pictus TaxID=7653 RepID=UPI0030B9BB20
MSSVIDGNVTHVPVLPSPTTVLNTAPPDKQGGGGGAVLNELYLKIIYALIGLLGIVGNSIVCLVFTVKRRHFQSITNYLILNQSIIDLVDSIFFILIHYASPYGPISETAALPSRGLAEFFCRMWDSEYPLWALYIASTANLVILSLERYFATCRPVIHRNFFTVRRAKWAMLCVWVYGAVYQLYWPLVQTFSEDWRCHPSWPNRVVQIFMGILLFTLEYLIPLIIMTFSYVSIIHMLRNRTKSHGKVQVNAFQRAKRNVTTTLCIVFVSYVVCWTPTELSYLAYNLGHAYNFESAIHDVVKGLVACNLCVNPFIYAFKYEHFQTELRNMFSSVCNPGNRISSEARGTVLSPANNSSNNTP